MATLLDRFTTRFDFSTDGSGLRKLERGIDSVRSKLDAAGTALAALGTGLTAAAGFTVKKFAEVESTFAEIEGLVGVSRTQLDAWLPDMERMAKATGKGINELADALFFITSAGFKDESALVILEKSAKASAAGLGEVKTIADLVTSALDVYSDGSLDAADATDQLVAAIREGKLDPSTLSDPLAELLPLAKELDIAFGEVAGAMAALSRSGFKAHKSNTALRGIMIKLTKPSKQGKEALEGVGYSLDEIHKIIEEEGMIQALRTLRNAFGENTEELAKLFEDSEGFIGVLALTSDKAAENADIIGRVASAHGDLDKALEPVLKTLNFRWSTVLARVSFLLYDMGERLAPFANDLISAAHAALDFYSALGDGPKDFIASILALGPAILGVGIGMKVLSVALGGLMPALRAMGAIIAPLRWAVVGLFWIIKRHPLVALGTAIGILVTHWDEISAAVSNAARVVKDTLQAWGVPVDGIFDWLTNAWSKVATDFRSVGYSIGDAIKGALVTAFDDLFNVMNAAVGNVDFAGIGISIGDFISDAIFSAISVGERLIEAIHTSITSFISSVDWASIGISIGGFIKASLTAAMSIWATFWTGAYNAMTVALNSVDWGSIGNKIGRLIRTAIIGLFSVVGDIIVAIKDFIVGGVTGAQDDPGTKIAFNALGKAVIGFLVAAIKAGVELVSSAILGLLGIEIEDPFAWMVTAWESMIASIRQMWSDFVNGMWGLIPAPIQKLINGDFSLPTVSDLKNAGANIAETVADGVDGAKNTVADALKGGLQKVRDNLPFSDAREGPLSDLTESGRSLMRTLAEGVMLGRMDLHNALVQALPVAPSPSAFHALQAQQSAGDGDRSISVNIEKMDISVPSGDPKEIASRMSGELRDQIRRAVEGADSQVLA